MRSKNELMKYTEFIHTVCIAILDLSTPNTNDAKQHKK